MEVLLEGRTATLCNKMTSQFNGSKLVLATEERYIEEKVHAHLILQLAGVDREKH